MDPEVARTLGELEHKLLELERTLSAMRTDEEPHDGHGSGSHETVQLPNATTAPPVAPRQQPWLEQDRG